jgi:Flavin containing amine oxidoreductase
MSKVIKKYLAQQPRRSDLGIGLHRRTQTFHPNTVHRPLLSLHSLYTIMSVVAQQCMLFIVCLVGVITSTSNVIVQATLCGRTDVLIVGAGFSGMAAAKELQAYNVSFRVVESMNRVGGRVSSKQVAEFGNLWIEEGAAWIYAYEGNPIFAYAKSKGIRMTLNSNRDAKFFEYDGKNVVRNLWWKPLAPRFCRIVLVLLNLSFRSSCSDRQKRPQG